MFFMLITVYCFLRFLALVVAAVWVAAHWAAVWSLWRN